MVKYKIEQEKNRWKFNLNWEQEIPFLLEYWMLFLCLDNHGSGGKNMEDKR